MKPTRAYCFGLTVFLGLVLSMLVAPASAQSSESAAGAGVAIVAGVAMLLILAIAVKMHDAKRKRDDEAMGLQARLSDALLLNPALARLPVAASVHTSMWDRSTMVVQATGQVPSWEFRNEALRVITENLVNQPGARLEDHISVNPAMLAHAA